MNTKWAIQYATYFLTKQICCVRGDGRKYRQGVCIAETNITVSQRTKSRRTYHVTEHFVPQSDKLLVESTRLSALGYCSRCCFQLSDHVRPFFGVVWHITRPFPKMLFVSVLIFCVFERVFLFIHVHCEEGNTHFHGLSLLSAHNLCNRWTIYISRTVCLAYEVLSCRPRPFITQYNHRRIYSRILLLQ